MSEDSNISTGIQSSAISITRSDRVSEFTHSELFLKLKTLAYSADAAAQSAKDVDVVFIFNGRTASTLPFRINAERNNIAARYYEFGPDGGRIFPFPPHLTYNYSELINDHWSRSCLTLAARYSTAFSWISSKFKNPFTQYYDDTLSGSFDAVYFVSSNDEYTAIYDPEWSHPFSNQLGVLKAIRDLFPMGDIAVRAHPNMQFANMEFEEDLRKQSQKLGCKFIDSRLKVDSYALIQNSRTVCVDMSSIGIEAAAMGKDLLVFGPAPYMGLIGQIVSPDRIDKAPGSLSGLGKIGFFYATYGFSLDKPSLLLSIRDKPLLLSIREKLHRIIKRHASIFTAYEIHRR